MIEKWKHLLDKKRYAGAITMDLSTAFNKINYELVLRKSYVFSLASIYS